MRDREVWAIPFPRATLKFPLAVIAKRTLHGVRREPVSSEMQNPAFGAGFAKSTGVERRFLLMDLLVLLLILLLIRKRRTRLRIEIDV